MAYAHAMSAQNPTPVDVIPRPLHVVVSEGSFQLTPQTRILVATGAEQEGKYLQDRLSPSTGYPLPLHPLPYEMDSLEGIYLKLDLSGEELGEEGYRLEVREVVAYARERFITVVPEIEMPGHSVAALAAYPKLGCTGGPYEVRTRWGIAKDVYCAGNEKVYAFLEDVLTEVMELFPSEYIHIGGDEYPKDRWEECEKCQTMIGKQGLEGGLAPNAAVMSWRGMEGGITAAEMGHDVVMSPTSHCYFDYYQSQNREQEPPAIGGFLPLETVYEFEPVPAALPEDKTHHILGAQGNLWTPPGLHSYEGFLERLPALLEHLDGLDVNYRPLKNTSP